MPTTLKIRSGVALVSLATIALSGTPLASATPAPLGSSIISTETGRSEVDLATREKADPFISVQGDQFTIDNAVESVLSPNEVRKVKASVEAANTAITSASSTADASVQKTANDKTVTFSQEAGPRIESTDGDMVNPYFQPGRNGIEYYWWGVKVLLSQGTVKAIGAGASIAGVWIPHPVVRGIAATLGIVISNVPGGIWADYSYAKFALFPINPAAATPIRVGFQ